MVDLEQITRIVLGVLGWSVAGMAALVVARYAYKIIAPFDAQKELLEDRNVAVGVSKGMFLIAAGVILHGIIVGEKLVGVLWMEIMLMIGLYILSLLLLWVGRLVMVAVTPYDFNEQIHIKDNLAVGLIEGSYYVGFAIIIHSAL